VVDGLVGASRRAAVARGSPVPGFLAYLGNEPLETWTRIRWPALNRWAVGQRRTVAAVTWSAAERLVRPSQTFHDLPSASTSQSRTKTSASGRLERNQICALTSPTTSTSDSSGPVV